MHPLGYGLIAWQRVIRGSQQHKRQRPSQERNPEREDAYWSSDRHLRVKRSEQTDFITACCGRPVNGIDNAVSLERLREVGKRLPPTGD